jgi:hypothetical protein
MSKEQWQTDFEDAIKGAVASGTKVVGVGPGGGTITVDANGDTVMDGNFVEMEVPKPPLEEALELALFKLGEIRLYAKYGRLEACEREADEAIEGLNELKAKWEAEQGGQDD